MPSLLFYAVISDSTLPSLSAATRRDATRCDRRSFNLHASYRIAVTFSPLTSAKRLQFDKRPTALSILFSLTFLNFALRSDAPRGDYGNALPRLGDSPLLIVAWNFDKSPPREQARKRGRSGNLFAEFRETFHVPRTARGSKS